MYEFKLPDLGEGVHEGEVLHWHVKPGDRVAEDDPLVEVETDKAAVTIPSPKAGKVVSVNGTVGETVAVGTVMVVIEDGAASEVGSSTPIAAGAGARGATVQDGATKDGGAGGEDRVAAAVPVSALAGTQPSQLELVRAGATPNPQATAVPAIPHVPVAPASASTSEQRPPVPAASAASTGAGPVAAAPATRRRAREMGIDLRQVQATGPGGRVTTDDLLRYAQGAGVEQAPARAAAPASPSDRPEAAAVGLARTPSSGTDTTDTSVYASVAVAPAARSAPVTGSGSAIPFFEVEQLPDFGELGPVDREPLRSIRRKVAHKMVASMTIVPHVAHMDEADVTELDAFRRDQNARRGDGVKLTLLSFVIKALVAQLKRWPQVNASIDPQRQEIVYKKYYNIGFAADTPKGLIVPVVAGADRLSISGIGQTIGQLAEKARAGTLEVSELRGGTFTVTNVGSLGGTNVVPTINYPEVAILGMGRAADKPVVRDGRIVVRKMLPMTLSFDHRLIDGADAARFVSALVGMLSDPGRLLIDC